MGKSFNKGKKQYSEKYEQSSSDYKRRKNKLREEHSTEEFFEYKHNKYYTDKEY